MDRSLSAGISIGTGLLLESIFKIKDRYDNDREIPNKVNIDKYDYHIYNLHTIVRNVISSFPRPNQGLEEKDLRNYVIDDLNLLCSYYEDSDCTPVLGVNDYDKLYKEFNKNKEYKATKNLISLLELNQWIKDQEFHKVRGLEMVILKPNKVDTDKTLITTSFLLDNDIYGVCDLLESHTGVFKSKHKWFTKYHPIGKQDLSHLPYSKYIHKILGDKTYVVPVKLSERMKLLELSEKWNTRTTDSRIRETIMKDQELNKYIK